MTVLWTGLRLEARYLDHHTTAEPSARKAADNSAIHGRPGVSKMAFVQGESHTWRWQPVGDGLHLSSAACIHTALSMRRQSTTAASELGGGAVD